MLKRDLLFLVVVLEACGGRSFPGGSVARPVPQDIASTILLIGDAGEPAQDSEPVLLAAAGAIGGDGARTTIVFLGDNIYPSGMPDSSDHYFPEAARRMDAQIRLVSANRAHGIFVPGNHDWANGGQDGWAAILRQARYVRRVGGGRVQFLPEGGCPGPSVVDAGGARLILLDTQWWLHNGPRPDMTDSHCAADTEGAVLDSLKGALARAGNRHVMVLAHHPLASGGLHSGHFAWTDHVFPLRHLVHWLWFPLPIIGSLYPLIRGAGVSPQDLPNSKNKAMRHAFEQVLAQHPPLIYGSGHDHNLQVIRGTSARFYLVSGGGFYGRPYPVTPVEGTLFANSAKGFMRIDIMNDRRVRLGVIAVHGGGVVTEEFSAWLTDSER